MPNEVKFNNDYPKIEESNKLYERAKGLIPAFSQTIAKGPTQYVNGLAPKYLVKGMGSHVWDVDGNEFIDYNMGVGPISLGYKYPKVDEAIKKQLENGITFSLIHPLEVEVAELIRQVIPNAQSVRYSKTGADVTSASIRLARAYTGKDIVLCCGYHGWHDWYACTLPLDLGIPEAIKNLTYTFSYNNIESLKNSLSENVAAIIMEPVTFEEPKEGFLHNVAKLCHEKDIVLIFDEMWTGFRMAIGGAQEYFGITPDLATYSKAVANGMPISILTGKKEIMQLLNDDIFFYSTFGGEALSLAAAKSTIEELREKNVFQYLDRQGKKIKDGYNSIAEKLDMDYTRIVGYNFRLLTKCDVKAGDPLILKSLVQQELIKRGILWSGFHNLCFSHTDKDIEYTLEVYEEVLTILKKSVEKNDTLMQLRGEPIKPTYRKSCDFNTKKVK